MTRLITLFAALCLLAPATGFAQDTVQPVDPPPGTLPPPQDDNDPAPPAPARITESPGITEQAGIGGTQAYGRAGVLELGGSLGFTGADDFSQFRASPSIGWFFADNLELSLLTSFNYFDLGDESQTAVSAVIEPSYHLPFNDTTFAFLGLGAGVSYFEDPGAGFLLSPRLGMNFLVGRSGVLSPYIHFDYSTVESISTKDGTLLAVNATYGANLGYTVMW